MRQARGETDEGGADGDDEPTVVVRLSPDGCACLEPAPGALARVGSGVRLGDIASTAIVVHAGERAPSTMDLPRFVSPADLLMRVDDDPLRRPRRASDETMIVSRRKIVERVAVREGVGSAGRQYVTPSWRADRSADVVTAVAAASALVAILIVARGGWGVAHTKESGAQGSSVEVRPADARPDALRDGLPPEASLDLRVDGSPAMATLKVRDSTSTSSLPSPTVRVATSRSGAETTPSTSGQADELGPLPSMETASNSGVSNPASAFAPEGAPPAQMRASRAGEPEARRTRVAAKHLRSTPPDDGRDLF